MRIQGFNREEIKQAAVLWKEYCELRDKLFCESKFAVLDDGSYETERYNQLLALFYPDFRTSTWVNPMMKEAVQS